MWNALPLIGFLLPSPMWSLGRHDAVVLIGRRPPAVEYFSFTTFALFTPRRGGPLLPFSSLGDSFNHLNLRTTEYGLFAHVVTGSAATYARVQATLTILILLRVLAILEHLPHLPFLLWSIIHTLHTHHTHRTHHTRTTYHHTYRSYCYDARVQATLVTAGLPADAINLAAVPDGLGLFDDAFHLGGQVRLGTHFETVLRLFRFENQTEGDAYLR